MALPAGNLYNFDNTNPSAYVVLNRGTEHELDITNDLISFNTSNSIDSSTGNFTVVLDNKNDHLVNRFNYSKIKKMSSIEIFAAPLEPALNNGNNGNSGATTSVPIPQTINGVVPTLKSMFDQVYPEVDPTEKQNLQAQFIALNSGRTTPAPVATINISDLSVQGISVGIFDNDGNPNPNLTTNCVIGFEAGPNTPKQLALEAGAADIQIGPDDSIIYQDASKLKFTINKVQLTNALQAYIYAATENQPQNLPQDANGNLNWDAPLTDQYRGAPLKYALPQGLFQRIFFGVIVNISTQISPGQGLTVTCNGEGIGYWLKISYIDVKPGGFEAQLVGEDVTAYSTKFTELKALDVFKQLIAASMDVPVVTNFNINTMNTTAEYLEVAGGGTGGQYLLDAYGNTVKVDTDGNPTTDGSGVALQLNGQTATQNLADLTNKQNALRVGIDIYSPTPSSITTPWTASPTTTDSNWSKKAQQYISNLNAIGNFREKLASIQSSLLSTPPTDTRAIAANKQAQQQCLAQINKLTQNNTDLWTQMSAIPEVANELAALNATSNAIQGKAGQNLQTGRAAVLKQTGIMQHWQQIFSQIVLEVINDDPFLQAVYPYSYIFNDISASLDGDYVSKETIARQIAEFLQYEFYFDTNGHFILKAPFVNMMPDTYNNMYTVDDNDVVNFSCNDTVDGMITRISVTGDFRESSVAGTPLIQNIFQDLSLIRDYGFHAKQVGGISYIQSVSDCRDYGIAMMTRANMSLFNASVTIHGRPGIRLGTPLYFKPRDTVYYIRDISHEFSVGGQYTTTLGLIAGRRIVTGFKSSTTVNNFNVQPTAVTTQATATTPQNTSTKNVITSVDSSGPIDHYIISDGFDQNTVLDFTQVQGVGAGQQAVSDASAAVGLNPSQYDRVFVLTNKYKIIDHPNWAYVGLIVDQQSDIIGDINLANFNYFFNLNPGNIPSDGSFGNLVPSAKTNVCNFIVSRFNYFCNGWNSNGTIDPAKQGWITITAANAKQLFTIDVRRQWISYFLASCANDVLGKPWDSFGNQTSQSNGQPATPVSENQTLIISQSANIFNLLVATIDNQGLYRQFTDAQGRELPAYQDYGMTLIYQSNLATINTANSTNAAVRNSSSQTAQAANTNNLSAQQQAQGASGVYNPNNPGFQDLIARHFSKYAGPTTTANGTNITTVTNNQPAGTPNG